MSPTEGVGTCPACGTTLREGANRCHGCGRVQGEDNRCLACDAIAAVRRTGAQFRCVACGRPREKLPGTVVVEDDKALAGRQSGVIEPLRAGGGSRWLWFGGAGAAMFAGSLLAAGTALVLGTGAGAAVGVAALVAAIVMGRAGVRAGAGSLAASRELKILKLAEASRGTVTVTQVATELAIPSKDAEAALGRLVGDGSRVHVEIQPDGVLHYVFREAMGSGDADEPRFRLRAEPPGEEEGVEQEEQRQSKARPAS